jgi:hypothetical protein
MISHLRRLCNLNIHQYEDLGSQVNAPRKGHATLVRQVFGLSVCLCQAHYWYSVLKCNISEYFHTALVFFDYEKINNTYNKIEIQNHCLV